MKKHSPLKFQFLKLAVANDKAGVAILMVMSSVALLAFLLADLTYETKLNKLKVYNQQEKFQARLNAEAGLRFALAKLIIYREARNFYEKTESVRQYLPLDKLEDTITMPFFFPIESALLAQANPIQRSAIEGFLKEIIIPGKMSVNMQTVSGLINVNSLRVPTVSQSNDSNDESTESTPDENDEEGDDDETGEKSADKSKKKPTDAFLEEELKKLLTDRLAKKREELENFDDLYGNPDVNLRVKELKFFVSSDRDFKDSERAELEAIYQDTTPKHAPLSSLSEIYLLKGWDDRLIDLIKDELTVHAASFVSIDKITAGQLRAFFPELTDDQVKEFYKIKGLKKDDGGENGLEGKPIKTLEDLKNVLVERMQAIEAQTFDDRVKEYANAGVQLGGGGKLFKVTSTGEYGRATYTLTAYIDLPIKDPPKKKKKEKNPNLPPGAPPPKEEEEDKPASETDKDGTKKADKKPPLEFMAPRIIELQIN